MPESSASDMSISTKRVVEAICLALVLCGCVSVSPPEQAPPPEPIARKASWFDCQTDSDCVLVRDGGCGTASSVNTSHATDFEQFVRYEMFRDKMPPCKQFRELNYIAICEESKCSSRRKSE